MTRRQTSRSMIWRAEIAATLLTDGEAAAALVAESLGMVLEERTAKVPEPLELDFGGLQVPGDDQGQIVLKDIESHPESMFWQPFYYEHRAKPEVTPIPEGRWGWRHPPKSPPDFIPIAPKRVVHPRLKTSVNSHSLGNSLDWPEIVRAVARHKIFHRFPRKRLRRWGRNIVVVLDGSDRLVPLFEDQCQLCRQLIALTSRSAITLLSADDPDGSFLDVNRSRGRSNWKFAPSSRVIVLSDLGVLQKGSSERLQARWAQWGQNLAKQGCSLIGLVPYPVQAARSELRQTFTLVPWQESAQHFVGDQSERAELVEQLLAAASPVVRLEPGLLRALRLVIPGAEDASLEADFWQHPNVTGRHVCAASLDREAMKEEAVPAFSKFPDDIKLKVLKAIRDWRYQFRNSPEVWFQEILNLDAESQKLLETLFPGDVDDAIQGFNHLAARASIRDETTLRLREYGGRAAHWFSAAAKQDPRIAQAIRTLGDASPLELNREVSGVDPALIPSQGVQLQITLSQVDNLFQFSTRPADDAQPLATLKSNNGWIDMASRQIHVDRNSFWKSGRPPAWAKDWGRDQYGAWASFEVPVPKNAQHGENEAAIRQPITQRMRWIPSGRFLMGSSYDDDSAYSDERPQHKVTLGQGFWMFDSTVTQELWLAVMGKNPSRFKGQKHPVETVSWDDSRAFLGRLNAAVAGMSVSLPSEAMWEYACRAGTHSAYSFGDDPARLGEFAWYERNSESTRPVALLFPNPWGLFDMHGNVWEWCQDYFRKETYKAGDAVDPPQGLNRVVRGGGWYSPAQSVRSACRTHFAHSFRGYGIGFRCAQVQAGSEPIEQDGKETKPNIGLTSGGGAIELRNDAAKSLEIPIAPIITVRTDADCLELHRIKKPSWGSDMGHDEYGLWSEFTISTPGDDPVVQRMRWIPPGHFLMGSPEAETGRKSNEGPQHPVTISYGYWMFDTPVTQQLWQAVMGKNPSFFIGAKRPVECVSWKMCRRFLDAIMTVVPGLKLKLPTEAEWEYAGRAGSQTAFSFGDNPLMIDKFAWHASNSSKITHEVAKKLPNEWGLFDMHGNVWEWCHDIWMNTYKAGHTADSVGPLQGDIRVLRGGCWHNGRREMRSAQRYCISSGYRSKKIGFRCVQIHPSSRVDE